MVVFAWKPADPVLGTHPQHAFSVLKYRFDGVIVQAVRIGWLSAVSNNLVALTIELQQPAITRTQPKRPIAVFRNGHHVSDALAARLSRVERVAVNSPSSRPGRSTRLHPRTHPKNSKLILMDDMHVVMAQAARICRFVPNVQTGLCILHLVKAASVPTHRLFWRSLKMVTLLLLRLPHPRHRACSGGTLPVAGPGGRGRHRFRSERPAGFLIDATNIVAAQACDY